MNQSFTAKLTRIISLTIAVILVLLPFHAFLSVWLASQVGHYTALRLWKEYLLAIMGLIAVVLLARDKALRTRLGEQRLIWIIGLYLLLELFLGFTSFTHHQVSAEAVAYGLLDDTRFLFFFVLCAVIAARDDWLRRHWRPIVLIPALVVVVFGLLQAFVLPHDVLQHFGYGLSTIPAIETVNSNAHYYRIQSTLRGANPLGAYLLFVISILGVLLIKAKNNRNKLIYGCGGLATLVALYFTYSRGAWIGVVLAGICTLAATIKSTRAKQLTAISLAVIIVIGGSAYLALRHNTRLENVVFHTSPHTVATTSDENHSSALVQGLHDIEHDPLGRGPGSAGPASVYNHDRPARIPENYFVQIGQEVGWLGLILFILITVLMALALWQLRSNPLALALFASLIGLSVVGLVSQVWTDDTISYLWWGLAGIIWAQVISTAKTAEKH
ncbi:MAG TPA: O-antigen ligase family protein [Candidatus Saccharimonadales bacterium]|nr:O-antigen ligase family protein [Candidatus Saccharimonadales bacterium]